MSYYHKSNIENDAFGYRFEIQSQTTKRKTRKKDVKEEILSWIKESDDEYDPYLDKMSEKPKKVRERHNCHQVI